MAPALAAAGRLESGPKGLGPEDCEPEPDGITGADCIPGLDGATTPGSWGRNKLAASAAADDGAGAIEGEPFPLLLAPPPKGLKPAPESPDMLLEQRNCPLSMRSWLVPRAKGSDYEKSNTALSSAGEERTTYLQQQARLSGQATED